MPTPKIDKCINGEIQMKTDIRRAFFSWIINEVK